MLASLPLALRLDKRLGLIVVAMLSVLSVAAVAVSGRPLIDHAASGLTVRMVQPAIPQQDKWKSELKDQHLAMHLEQTMPSEDQSKPDLLSGVKSVMQAFMNMTGRISKRICLRRRLALRGFTWRFKAAENI